MLLSNISATPSKTRAAPPAAALPSPPPAGRAENAGAPAASAPPPVSWLDSNDPRRRLIGKIVLVGVWAYVAALWLLALDQTFHWAIF